MASLRINGEIRGKKQAQKKNKKQDDREKSEIASKYVAKQI